MGFWVFMFVFTLMIPLTMVGFGHYFINKAPKEINVIFGYRTSMSMKNKDTWKFAHTYCGKLWRTIGWIMILITILGMLILIGREQEVIGNWGARICILQTVFLVGSIIPTERALRRTFDKKGNRRDSI